MKMLMISTVQTFFKQRAGMFFVLLGILFGFMSGREHYGFALFFLTDPNGMFYLALIWCLYALLCAHFIQHLWAQETYAFIYHARLWPLPTRLFRFVMMALGFLQPILYYGVYLVGIARQDHLLKNVWPIFIFYLLLSYCIAGVANWRISNPSFSVSKRKTGFRWHFPRPVSWIYWSLEWLFREKGFTLLLCKTGAIGVVVCTLIYYQTDTFDLRLPAIGFSLAYLLNVGLSYEYFLWENDIMFWHKSLPFSRTRRFARIVILHAVILLPETLIAARYQLLSLTEIIELFVLGTSCLLLFHSYLYKKGGFLDDMMKPVLLGFVLLTFLILYSVPVWGIAVLLSSWAYYMFSKWYDRPRISI